MCRENRSCKTINGHPSETSLHAQRKQPLCGNRSHRTRNISAHTEKTRTPYPQFCPLRKHLCMCRENALTTPCSAFNVETSLHVQRKLCLLLETNYCVGNISACAEKTTKGRADCTDSEETSLHVQRKLLDRSVNPSLLQKHLCMCRENRWPFETLERIRETSLHVQRKLLFSSIAFLLCRNISACAEKTILPMRSASELEKHLCMCRENRNLQQSQEQSRETSLHVQRKPNDKDETLYHPRNISACAEKTATEALRASVNEKHLCMCRENEYPFLRIKSEKETSLHVQRKRAKTIKTIGVYRNISACAEKTIKSASEQAHNEKHLCMCRENCRPARTRSASRRNISACAEKTQCTSYQEQR